ncbi:MAG: Bug family tripartite tricarboxylate transporter substrate binding protein [Lautropia sp.]
MRHCPRLFATIAALLCMAIPPGIGPAAAQTAERFPERPIRIVVPFPPGGGVDQVARIFAPKLHAALGQPVIVDNRGGAGGTIGASAVAKAEPDGYTLLLGTASTHGTNSAVQAQLPYDPIKDFAPVSLLLETPYALVANTSVPVSNVRELNEYASKHPGKLNFGTFGSGSSNHLAAELYKALSGADIVHVPYRGAAPAMADLLAGQIQIMFDTLPSSLPHLRSGKLKLLGIGGRERSRLFPDAPTIAASGVPGYDAGTWFAVWAPAGTPAPVVDKLQRAFLGVLAEPEVRDQFLAIGQEPIGSGPQALGERVQDEVARWRKLVSERQLKFD